MQQRRGLQCQNGSNIGTNVGEAAGQTVPHLHLYIIPRYGGDVERPHGGARHRR